MHGRFGPFVTDDSHTMTLIIASFSITKVARPLASKAVGLVASASSGCGTTCISSYFGLQVSLMAIPLCGSLSPECQQSRSYDAR